MSCCCFLSGTGGWGGGQRILCKLKEKYGASSSIKNLFIKIVPLLVSERLNRGGPKGVGPGPTLAWPGWKQPDISVEVDTDRLETSRSEAGVLKKLS
jgi:hypothetical protein